MRKITPSKIMAFVKERLSTPVPDFVGVYSSFAEVPDDNPWTKPAWIDGNYAKMEALDHSRFSHDRAEAHFVSSPNTIPAMLLNLATDRVRVLDFGGGTGYTFFAMQRFLSVAVDFEWIVVDSNASLYEAGTSYASQHPEFSGKLTFSKELPTGKIDMIHIASTLQYVDDPVALLSTLASAYNPSYFVLTRTLAGHLETFVTQQTIGGFRTPCQFICIDELRGCMEQAGYDEILAAPCGGFARSQFKNVPATQQIKASVDLVFKARP